MHAAKWLLEKYADNKNTQDSKKNYIKNLLVNDESRLDWAQKLHCILLNIFMSPYCEYFITNIFERKQLETLNSFNTRMLFLHACEEKNLQYLQWIVETNGLSLSPDELSQEDILNKSAASCNNLDAIKFLLDAKGGRFKVVPNEDFAVSAVLMSRINTLEWLSDKVDLKEFKGLNGCIIQSSPAAIEWLLAQLEKNENKMTIQPDFFSSYLDVHSEMSPATFVYLRSCHQIEPTEDVINHYKNRRSNINLVQFSIFAHPENNKTKNPKLLQTLLDTRFHKESTVVGLQRITGPK
jgi:hypothetical protein